MASTSSGFTGKIACKWAKSTGQSSKSTSICQVWALMCSRIYKNLTLFRFINDFIFSLYFCLCICFNFLPLFDILQVLKIRCIVLWNFTLCFGRWKDLKAWEILMITFHLLVKLWIWRENSHHQIMTQATWTFFGSEG